MENQGKQKLYFLKLSKDFLQDERVRAIKLWAGGFEYFSLYIEMLVESLANGGFIEKTGLYRVTANGLNIRSGPDVRYKIVGCIRDKGIYTITAVNGKWGKLKSGQGWISLPYCQLVSGAPQIPYIRPFKVGDKVRIKRGARTYEGRKVSSFVYDKSHIIDELKGDRAVLDKNGICTAFNIADLK